jgi:hypothetical protein
VVGNFKDMAEEKTSNQDKPIQTEATEKPAQKTG